MRFVKLYLDFTWKFPFNFPSISENNESRINTIHSFHESKTKTTHSSGFWLVTFCLSLSFKSSKVQKSKIINFYREHEEGGGEVEAVRPGQAHHKGVEGVDLVGVTGEKQDEQHVADDPDDGHDHQQQTLHIELECLRELFRRSEIHHVLSFDF